MRSTDTNRVMIVEDAIDMQALLYRLLTAHGFVVECAQNGLDALEKLRRSEVLPSVILLDIMMPIMDGFKFRDHQLRDARLAQVPVIVMTASANIASGAAVGEAQGFIKKPFLDLDALVHMVRRLAKSCVTAELPPENVALGTV